MRNRNKITFLSQYFTPTLFILSLLAFLLRFPGITSILSGDEIPNFSWYSFIPWGELIFSYSDPNQHTLFIVFARLSMALFGESEMIFRLPVLITGVLAVPLTFKVAFILLKSYSTSLLSSLLFCFAFYPIYYSQHGRSYSLTIFLALALIYLVMKLYQLQETRVWTWLFPILALAIILAAPSNTYFFNGFANF